MTQGIGTDSGGVNLSIALANRGKRSVALDLRHEEGRAILHELLETADVFLTNFRPGALRRLGLDAETLTERYPSLVYARGHGYGVRGPDADQPGYDSSAFWARGGMAHVLTPAELDQPIGQRGAMGDRNGAMALAFGMAAALLERTRTGRGSVVDVSLLGIAMWTLSSDVLSALQGQQPRAMSGREVRTSTRSSGTYRTKDGRHISLVFLEADRYWADFCRVLGRDDLADDPRFVDLQARREHARGVRRGAPGGVRRPHVRGVEDVARAASTRRGRRCRRSRSCSTTRRCVANDYIGDVVVDGGPAYRLPDGAGAVRRTGAGPAPGVRSTASTRSCSCSSSGTRGSASGSCRTPA